MTVFITVGLPLKKCCIPQRMTTVSLTTETNTIELRTFTKANSANGSRYYLFLDKRKMVFAGNRG